MHVQHANRTVLFHFLRDANMIISQLDSHTSAANVAMEEPFFRPDAANATPFAVKRFLFVPFVVEHVAD